MLLALERHAPGSAAARTTNISETLTATTTANVFSGVRRPCSNVLLHPNRLADGREHVLAQAQILRRELRELRDPFQLCAVCARAAGAR